MPLCVCVGAPECACAVLLCRCSGCDAWNTGVMVLPKSARSEVCLSRWRRALESGEFPTDQEALAAVAIHG